MQSASRYGSGLKCSSPQRRNPPAPSGQDDARDDQVFLGAGRHRLEAWRRLYPGEIIVCSVLRCDEREARLWEISENLHRAELTEAERRQHIAERVKLTAGKLLTVSNSRLTATTQRKRRLARPPANLALAEWPYHAPWRPRAYLRKRVR